MTGVLYVRAEGKPGESDCEVHVGQTRIVCLMTLEAFSKTCRYFAVLESSRAAVHLKSSPLSILAVSGISLAESG